MRTPRSYERVREALLSLLRVPPEPHAPAGDPASLRVFRAGRRYFHLRVLRWGLGQALALAGLVFWLVVLIDVQGEAVRRHEASATTSGRTAGDLPPGTVLGGDAASESEAAPAKKQNGGKRIRIREWDGFKEALVQFALHTPPWALNLVWVLKFVGIAAYLAQLPVTLLIARIDYEMRWYIVTDRSLRLRWGTVRVQEMTMSFANLQQVEVHQGPLQRLLGLADVQVRSAGGGGGGDSSSYEKDKDSMHQARFHGVTNADEIRDLILDRLRRFRAAGLGDPDDHSDDIAPTPVTGAPHDVLVAAREFAAEARALRTSL